MLFKIIIFIVFINSVYSDGFLPPGYEEVTEKKEDGFGAIEKCGEGESKGVDLCVPYYQCDGETKMIIQNKSTNGFGIIDIRFGDDKPCQHYLDVCCGIPKDGVTPSSPTDVEIPPEIVVPVEPTKPKPKPTNRWTCGIRNNNGIDFKIKGNLNHESEYGEFPWMVAIIKKHFDPNGNDNLLICGGSLITPNIVLTGAHCIGKFKKQDIRIRAGEWDTQTDKERFPYQERGIKEIIIHEQFNPKTLFNDVALLILDTPVDEAENIGIICLPQDGAIVDSSNCLATGWGKDRYGAEGLYQNILKKIELPSVPHGECQDRLRETRLGKYFILDKSFMCAGGEKGRDTCTGDGGSPLVCPDPNQPHRYIQAGIVAWGIGCGDPIPAVYVNVPKFRKWIDDKLKYLDGSYN